MGVPKFYRWISERYPCLSEVVKEHQIPEFDNLYLDMNGIIHQCSHPNDEDVHFRITDDKIFADIFHYLEVLFRIIKPRKVFFMAVDGVAPRAKMNQQRGRRFRSAKEAEDKIKKAIEKGEILPSEARFDSNCITPGTDFMARLHEHLKYFVNMKISTDKSWQGVSVYLSGHETPGEGEHKIMEFIRSEKARPDHNPNTRHCLYGLDADLIMLGLTSHETHFSLLREEVRFGGKKNQKRISAPEETTFHLLHLSLMREYIGYEFSLLRDKISFEYNVERIIDDWILMGFLVGNDFIPHLPHLHINHDALPLLYRTYISVLPQLGGYINESGHLNLVHFEKYLAKLADFDREHFNEVFVDLKWFESKVGNKYLNEAAGNAAEEARKCKEKKRKFTGCAFASASIWQYEALKFRVQSYFDVAQADWLDKKRGNKELDFRKQVNKWWNSLTEGQQTVTGIIAANILVFCLWRVPSMQRTMIKYFTSNPASRTLCLPMILSTFSHFSLFHLGANMYVLWSFSSSIVSLLGPEQFMAVYLSAGVISSFASYAAKMATGRFGPSLGASGAIMTVLAAVCTKMPEAKLAIIFLPMFTFTAASALKGIMALDTAGLILGWRIFDHAAHLGGAIFGIWYVTYGHELMWKKREPLVKMWHEWRTKTPGKRGGS